MTPPTEGGRVKVASERETCVFCQIVAGDAPAAIVEDGGGTLAFVPLSPVTPGHVLVVPKVHVRDATTDPGVTGLTMAAAARLAVDLWPCNLITSAGALATQSVFHLHVHVVPRREGDGLMLPWTALGHHPTEVEA